VRNASERRNASYALALLRLCRQRPRRRRAAEQRDELAPFHQHFSRASKRKIARRETYRTAGFRTRLCQLSVCAGEKRPWEQQEFAFLAAFASGALHFLRSDYALIAAMSGWMPMMFITRVRL